MTTKTLKAKQLIYSKKEQAKKKREKIVNKCLSHLFVKITTKLFLIA